MHTPPQSTRCNFRRFNSKDLSLLQKLETNPEVVKFTSLRIPQTQEQTQLRLKKNIETQKDLEPLGIWAVLDSKSGNFIGWSMLMMREFRYPELGYMIVPEYWGQGFASEIALCLADYGMQTLKYKGISACTDLDNIPSIRVLEKAGFKYAGTLTKPDAVLGGDCVLKVFEKT